MSLVGTITSLELNPFADKKIVEKTITQDMSNFIKEDFNTKYGVIQLSKTALWIETDKIAEYSLTKNTEQCIDYNIPCFKMLQTYKPNSGGLLLPGWAIKNTA